MAGVGRFLILCGLILLFLGALLIFAPKIPGLKHLGRLPGDIVVKKDSFQFYFPIVTSLIVSLLLTLLFQLIHFFKNR